MKKSCQYCGRIHPVGYTCPSKPVRNHRGTSDPRLRAYRSSKRWQEAREGILERDYHICRVCETQKHGTYNGQRYYSDKLEVHHIVPLAEDFTLRADEDNLITLCPMHHSMAEDGTIGRDELKALADSDIIF